MRHLLPRRYLDLAVIHWRTLVFACAALSAAYPPARVLVQGKVGWAEGALFAIGTFSMLMLEYTKR